MKYSIALTLILLLACSDSYEDPLSVKPAVEIEPPRPQSVLMINVGWGNWDDNDHVETAWMMETVMPIDPYDWHQLAKLNLAAIGTTHICVMSPCIYCAAMRGRNHRGGAPDSIPPIRRFEPPINILPWGFGGPPNGLWD